MRSVWTELDWSALEQATSRACLESRSADREWKVVSRAARSVLREYSTSFFLVTRFLPPKKRAEVEVVYAAVRYPDEIVDTFPLSPEARVRALCDWENDYETALKSAGFRQSLQSGLNCFASAFAEVVRRRSIPPEHYRSFLAAMKLDAFPRPFADLDDLVDSYIYGSATVVGYFLAYVYGPSRPAVFPSTLAASKDLGIALQLTNFLRDVREDERRGRVYLPQDFLRAEGLTSVDSTSGLHIEALNRVLRRLSAVAEAHYAAAERALPAFSPDCRTAIRACIDVYRQLNLRIGRSELGILHRESVPLSTKFRVLPGSKYWRLPLAYMGAL